MLQVLQNLKDGATTLAEVPAAAAASGGVVIRAAASVISAGTERMLLDFGKAGWASKARRQPDKVRMVLEKVKTDGIIATIESVLAKLDQPVALGYSNAGIVLEVGSGVTEFKPGDRVVSNGPHSEVVSVPRSLCAKIPDNVSDDAATFTVLGAIALQGIRLAQPTLGETVVVTGLGLIGLITVQLLRAHGCRVLGIDIDPRKLEIARSFGAETVNLSASEAPVASAERFSRGRGIDAVIITASTKSSEPVHQAALMCRKRGRIVLVGITGLELSRDDFYKKELTFQVSCSYGPGRYDPSYESGQDYPYPFVRWTAQRNFEAVLDMLASGRLDVAPLVTHRFPIKRVAEAYELLFSDEPYLGIVLEYPAEATDSGINARTIEISSSPAAPGPAHVAFIGAGGYASKVLIPAFKQAGAGLVTVASSGGLSCAHAARKFGFRRATTDLDAIFSDEAIRAVAIATRHDSHARLVCRALESGKHVFVEKPLAIADEELDRIETLHGTLASPPLLMVGFNRRFAPHVVKMKSLLETVRGPKSVVITVNAGAIPADHWIQDPEVGGGRIIGEACHFIDLIRFFVAAPVKSVQTAVLSRDTVTINLSYQDGSIGAVHYFANGSRRFPKERIEVFCAGRILQLDNFRKLRGWGWPRFRTMNLWRQDKGNAACVAAFVDALRAGNPSPIPFAELLEVTRTTLLSALRVSVVNS